MTNLSPKLDYVGWPMRDELTQGEGGAWLGRGLLFGGEFCRFRLVRVLRQDFNSVMTPLLHIYLQDHLAGATFGYQLAERCRRKNRHSEFGAPLAELASEIASDRESLVAVMRRVGAERSNVKVSAAWFSEKIRRLKPNGRLLSYTPLSRVVELEGLVIGIAGKRALWRTLESLAPQGGELEGFDFTVLAERAEDQLERVERLRLQAARVAFARENQAAPRD
jgi:hypothetical protein